MKNYKLIGAIPVFLQENRPALKHLEEAVICAYQDYVKVQLDNCFGMIDHEEVEEAESKVLQTRNDLLTAIGRIRSLAPRPDTLVYEELTNPKE